MSPSGVTTEAGVLGARRGRVCFVLLVALALSGLCSCSGPDLADLHWVDVVWASFDPGTDAPGGWDRSALLVPVRIGKDQAYFQLDTGARNTLLYRDTAEALGLEYELGERLKAAAESGRFWRAGVRDFELSHLKMSDVDIIAWEAPQDPNRDRLRARFGETAPVVGTLGTDVLSSHCLVLDLDRGRMALTSRRPRVAGEEVPFDLVSGKPVLHVGGGFSLRAAYDTGSSAFTLICSPETFAESTKEATEFWDLETTGQLGAVSIRAAACDLVVSVGQVRLPVGQLYGATLVDSLRTASGDRIDAIIGNELFRGRLVILDFRSRLLVLVEP